MGRSRQLPTVLEENFEIYVFSNLKVICTHNKMEHYTLLRYDLKYLYHTAFFPWLHFFEPRIISFPNVNSIVIEK